jgi:hypothetical protein
VRVLDGACLDRLSSDLLIDGIFGVELRNTLGIASMNSDDGRTHDRASRINDERQQSTAAQQGASQPLLFQPPTPA